MVLRSLIGLLCFVGASSVIAQTNVSGRVVDLDGASVGGVVVTLSPEPAGVAGASTSTDADGIFRLLRVSEGEYGLDVAAQFGFQRYHLVLHVGRTSEGSIRIELLPAPVAQNLTVKSQAGEVSAEQNANREQVGVDANLLGKVPVFDQNYIAALSPFLDQAGVGTSGVAVIVDGVEMKGTGVSASAIAEARINNDPYSAETNRPGKGRIEIITKPGSSQLHGTLNFTFRDSVFDAKNYFAVTKPLEQKRIYEGSITGSLGTDHRTTVLLSGSRQEDNLQSTVRAATPAGPVTANVPTPLYDTEFAVRAAHEFSASHRISLQYNVADTITRNQGVGGLVLTSAGVNAQAREDDVIFTDRLILSPTLLNQAQLFFEKDYDPVRSVSGAQKIAVDGTFTGGGAQADFLQTENNLKINDTVSWSHKQHFVKFGVNIPNLSRRAWEDRSDRAGTYNFGSLSDYEAGTPYSFTQQAGPGRTTFWMNEIGTFVQGQIQVGPTMQVSLGLRYDWQTYFKSSHDFAPRVSIAKTTADHRTVLRAGAGIFYDRSGAQPMADLKRFTA